MRTIIFASLVWLTGCGLKTTAQTNSDTGSNDWWDGSSSDSTSTDNQDDDDEDDEDDEEEEEEEDEEGGEDDEELEEDEEDELVNEEALWAALLPSENAAALGYFKSTTDGVACDIEYEASLRADSSCSACSQAFKITVGAQDFSEGSDCPSAYTALEGSVFLFGFSGEVLYQNTGSGWASVEEGFVESEGDEIFLEVILSADE